MYFVFVVAMVRVSGFPAENLLVKVGGLAIRPGGGRGGNPFMQVDLLGLFSCRLSDICPAA